MTAVYRIILAGLVTGFIALTGCGGGGGGTNVAGIGGTGRTISGTITGFGSIFVNQVEYDIDNADISINDDNNPGLSQADLRIGMLVTLVGNDDGTVGVASQVVYDNEITGPVSGLVTTTLPGGGEKKSFLIFGADIEVKDTAEFDNGVTFPSLADGDIVEVSGLFNSSTTLIATYIKKTDDLNPGNSEVKIKGAPATGTDAGAGDSFIMNNNATVNIIDGITDLSDLPGNRVSDTQFIEVKGILVSDIPVVIDALSIELEDEGIGSDGDEVSIEGFISEFVDNSNFKVSGQQVDATGAAFVPAGLALNNDLRVEVEGTVVNGTLIADKVTLED